uniref:Uncharacterized protein n=1 Tax=Romanomermis culicivorax TaxID=13658 RepID=A0A915J8H6_ROMCU
MLQTKYRLIIKNQSRQTFYKKQTIDMHLYEGDSAFDTAICNDLEYMLKTHKLELTVNRLLNYTSEMSLHADSVYEILSGSGQAIGNTISGAGQVLEHMEAHLIRLYDLKTVSIYT